MVESVIYLCVNRKVCILPCLNVEGLTVYSVQDGDIKILKISSCF